MSKPRKPGFHLNLRGVLEIAAVVTIMGGILTAFNFRLMTPAEALEEHIVDFQHHDSLFVAHVTDDAGKQESRDQRTQLIEAQTRLTCIESDPDDLALAGLGPVCDSLR